MSVPGRVREVSAELARLERACARLDAALHAGNDEISALAATTLRTHLMLTRREVAAARDDRAAAIQFDSLQTRAAALLARAALQLCAPRPNT